MKRVFVLLMLPGAFALFEAAGFHLRNRDNGTLVSSGREYTYLLHVPRGCGRSRPVPLVVSLHGAGGWGVQQKEASGWNELADREGFIAVYPTAAGNAGPRTWDRGDVQFISDLLDRLESEYAIDRDRIYVNGLSNGGGMSFVLSCAMADRIAAAGMVAAAQTEPFASCGASPPVPMIAFHGTRDAVAPYHGGSSWIWSGGFPDIANWTAKWAKRNRCGRAIDTRIAADVMRRAYEGCGADVVLYTIEQGGHNWPGHDELPEGITGRTTHSIDATREMWEFFKAHPRVSRSTTSHAPA